MGHAREVVVITGASAGVGRAVVRRFAKDGARIGLIARGIDGLEAAKREVEQAGGEALVLPLDVADADAVESAAQRVEDAFGPIDIWINDAMVSVFSPVHEMTPADYRRVTEVNYLGYVHGTLAALKRMKPRDAGVIVQVGSALAYRGIPLQSAYCATKHAIQGFNDSLRCELLHDRSGVKITMVQLPGVNTTQFGWVKSRLPGQPKPLGAVFQPEVAADAIHFAAHEGKREYLLGFPTVEAVVGNKLLPSLGDRYLAKHGVDGQQRDEPTSPDRRDNLYAPLPGDHGAHGPFGDRARTFSWEFWLAKHRELLGSALALAGGAFLGNRLRSRRAAPRRRSAGGSLAART